MDKRLMHYEFPCRKIPQLDGTMVDLSIKIAAVVADTSELAIVQAVKEAATASGVTDLYILDKKFILDAIRDKLDREKPKPLTIEELREMHGEPVWLDGFEWRVCYGTSTFRGSEYLETGSGSGIPLDDYGERWNAYRHKPKEEES